MKLYIGNGFWEVEEETHTAVPTGDNDFYILIPNGSPKLFRVFKVDDRDHVLFWEEDGELDSIRHSFNVSYAFREKMWVKQEKVPNDSQLLTVTLNQAKLVASINHE